MQTERLFHQDSRQVEFDAAVIERRDEGRILVLDRTCFYPESGGQPPDAGTLNGIPVTDVQEEGEAVVHVLETPVEGDSVHGVVDWTLRFDHMQQHTGQHILSQAFLQVAHAPTVGFHLGKETSTVDFRIPQLSGETACRAENLANAIIYEDRPILLHSGPPEEIGRLPLRKKPPRVETVRVVEVEGFDFSPCGGTHCGRTGEVGMVKIRSWEKIRGDMRVEILCGWRALRDYRWKTEAINRVAGELTIADRDLEKAFRRLREENAEKTRRIRELAPVVLGVEARGLVEAQPSAGGRRLIVRVYQNRPPEELRILAKKIVEHPSCIALLASKGERTHLLFARSGDVDRDMLVLLKEVLEDLGGKGGGSPAFAEGGGAVIEDVPALLELVARRIAE
jgi:alanyl-tRNA synthetase